MQQYLENITRRSNILLSETSVIMDRFNRDHERFEAENRPDLINAAMSETLFDLTQALNSFYQVEDLIKLPFSRAFDPHDSDNAFWYKYFEQGGVDLKASVEAGAFQEDYRRIREQELAADPELTELKELVDGDTASLDATAPEVEYSEPATAPVLAPFEELHAFTGAADPTDLAKVAMEDVDVKAVTAEVAVESEVVLDEPATQGDVAIDLTEAPLDEDDISGFDIEDSKFDSVEGIF